MHCRIFCKNKKQNLLLTYCRYGNITFTIFFKFLIGCIRINKTKPNPVLDSKFPNDIKWNNKRSNKNLHTANMPISIEREKKCLPDDNKPKKVVSLKSKKKKHHHNTLIMLKFNVLFVSSQQRQVTYYAHNINFDYQGNSFDCPHITSHITKMNNSLFIHLNISDWMLR